VFRYDPSAPRVAQPEGFSARRFGTAGEISEDLADTLTVQYGDEIVRTDLIGIKDRGCVLWVACMGPEIACIALSRTGRHIPRWFLPLRESDIVIFRVNTMPEHRGKGVSPALTQFILANELTTEATAYWDCKIYNRSSIRAAEKAGFSRIAKMRPLPPEDWRVSDRHRP
jgi:RimJ/RimL family protein N-acetyltransferase